MKGLVAIPPKFDHNDIKFNIFSKYLDKYDVVTDSGEYLPWGKLKWQIAKDISKDEEIKKAWMAIKFKRYTKSEAIAFVDKNDLIFNYCLPAPLDAKLHKIIKASGASAGVAAGMVTSPAQKNRYLVSSLIMEEAISSAQLEGAATTRAVAKKMLEEERTPADEDEQMIINNYMLLKAAESYKNKELSLDMILEFHYIATQGVDENENIPGKFRKDDDIKVYDSEGEIAHEPPSHKDIVTRMLAYCDFANTDHSSIEGKEFISPVIKGIILHFLMGYEHPFRDGNGRTARALFYWFMLKHEYNIFKYVSISKLLKEDPKQYGLSYLYTETDYNDMTYFIDYQLDIILKAIDELIDYLNGQAESFDEILKILDGSKYERLAFMEKDILKKSLKNPGRTFTVKEIANSYSCSDNTARKYLNNLVSEKLLLPSKNSQQNLYVVPRDLEERLNQHD